METTMLRQLCALAAGACLSAIWLSTAPAQVASTVGPEPSAPTGPLAPLRVAEPAHDDGNGHNGHTAEHHLGHLTITGAFARASVIDTSAAYVTIANDGDEDDLLVSAHTPMAHRVELHDMTMEGDVMRMHPVEGGIPVPSQGSVTLAPGGMHVMMLGLTGPLEEGGSLPLTLTFEHAGEITLEIPILQPGAGASDMSGHHGG
jgi:copper(I)-binding protein